MLPAGLGSPHSKAPITLSKVLIVEGHDAFQFFEALLRHLQLLSEIEIRNYGGVNDLAAYLKTLCVTPGFHTVNSLGIARDAEGDPFAAFSSVCSALRNVGLAVPGRDARRR